MLFFKKLAYIPVFENSPRYIDIAIENGMVMRIANNEVKSVPTTKGNAPNCSNTGSQILPVKNLKPNILIEGMELIINDKNMDNVSTKMSMPENKRIVLNKKSGIDC